MGRFEAVGGAILGTATMRIVAIETSGRQGSVAALAGEADDARLLRQTVLAGPERTAQTLAPALRELLAALGWTPGDIGLVCVAVGPGSFTGLRIGVTTAKTLAYAVGAEVVGVNSLVSLAAQTPPAPQPLWAILDAQRRELFAARFDAVDREHLLLPPETRIIAQDTWLTGLRPSDRVVGPPLRRLAGQLPAGVAVAANEHWQPTAAAVGRVGWLAYRAGRRDDDVWQLVPQYYRPSYAEEKSLGSASRQRGTADQKE